MSSVKLRFLRNSPYFISPLFSMFNFLNMLSGLSVNTLGEMKDPCLTAIGHASLDVLTLFVRMYCYRALHVYFCQATYVDGRKRENSSF